MGKSRDKKRLERRKEIYREGGLLLIKWRGLPIRVRSFSPVNGTMGPCGSLLPMTNNDKVVQIGVHKESNLGPIKMQQ